MRFRSANLHSPTVAGATESHVQEANESLLRAMEGDPNFAPKSDLGMSWHEPPQVWRLESHRAHGHGTMWLSGV